MKKKSKSMGIEVYILLIVILITMTSVGSFMLGRKSNNTNIENKNENINNNDNKKDDNVSIEKLVNDSDKLSDKDRVEFLDKILGEYLYNTYNDKGEKVYCNGYGIYLSKEGTEYKYLSYQLCTDRGQTGLVVDVKKYNDKYILKIYYPEMDGVLTSYQERNSYIVLDISKLSDDKLIVLGSITQNTDSSEKHINEDSLEYKTFHGSFDDWDSKIG